MSEQLPAIVEIAPTVVVSNSDGVTINEEPITASNEADPDGSGIASTSEPVRVAEIEAERDVTLAAIAGDVERERIRLEQQQIEVNAEKNEEVEECRREIAELRERVEALQLSILPPQLEEAVMEQLETVPELNLTEPSTAVPTVETQTEHGEENAEENLEVEVEVRAGPKFRAI